MRRDKHTNSSPDLRHWNRMGMSFAGLWSSSLTCLLWVGLSHCGMAIIVQWLFLHISVVEYSSRKPCQVKGLCFLLAMAKTLLQDTRVLSIAILPKVYKDDNNIYSIAHNLAKSIYFCHWRGVAVLSYFEWIILGQGFVFAAILINIINCYLFW